MKKILCILLGCLLFAYCINEYEQRHPIVYKIDFKEGDILFQESHSKQSPFIQHATGSKWTHCGIVVYKNNQPYVLEASNVVKLIPLGKWLDRGDYKQRRVLSNCPKIKYKKYLGKPYDTSFRLDNDKYYCSELVYDIYKNQLGVEFKLRRVKDYNINGLESILKNRNIHLNQEVIAPSDLLK